MLGFQSISNFEIFTFFEWSQSRLQILAPDPLAITGAAEVAKKGRTGEGAAPQQHCCPNLFSLVMTSNVIQK